MKLTFLIQMMLLLLLVVGVYLLFTDSIQGRMKLIIIVFCLVVGVYLFMKLPMFKDNNEILSSPQNAKNEYIIKGEELKKSDGPMGLSCWIYIDNWNYKYGQKKTLISSENIYFPVITLDEYKNDLNVSVNVYRDDNNKYTEEQLKFELDNNGYTKSYSDDDSIECSSNTITVNDEDTGVACPSGSPEDVIIENINIQKWVNVVVTFNNRTLDVYLNGKLSRSCTLEEVPKIGKGDVFINQDGGYNGELSDLVSTSNEESYMSIIASPAL